MRPPSGSVGATVPRITKAIPLEQAFDGTIGLQFDPTSTDPVTASVPVRDGLCNPFGIVHGGVYRRGALTPRRPCG